MTLSQRWKWVLNFGAAAFFLVVVGACTTGSRGDLTPSGSGSAARTIKVYQSPT